MRVVVKVAIQHCHGPLGGVHPISRIGIIGERGLTGRQELVSHQLDQAIVPNELNGWVKLVEGNIQT